MNNGTKITAPISLHGDVYPVLAIAPSGAMYDVAEACTSEKINKYSRRKPVRVNTPTELTEEQFKSVNYGIVMPDVVVGSSLDALYIQDACGNSWGYDLPQGTDFKRLTDFESYYHGAVPPIQMVGKDFSINKAQSSRLVIGFDLDPDDSTYNLQAYDLVGDSLNLNEYKLIACVFDYSGDIVIPPTACDDFILNDGELAGSTIVIDVSDLHEMQKGYEYQLYVCMYRFNNISGKYEFVPLPDSTDYNSFPAKLIVTDDAIGGGGGIQDPANDVAFSPSFSSVYYDAADCVDEEGGRMVMQNNTGDLIVRCLITNGSNSNTIVNRTSFSAEQYYGAPYGSVTPTYIYDSQPTGAGVSSTSITIPANGSKLVYLYFQAFMYMVKDTAIGNIVEISINRGSAAIYNGALNYRYSTSVGWTQK